MEKKKFYEKENISKLINEGNYKGRYFRVELLDEEGYGTIDLIGRYPSLMTAKAACNDYDGEEIDGCGQYRICEFIIDETGKHRTEREAIFY